MPDWIEYSNGIQAMAKITDLSKLLDNAAVKLSADQAWRKLRMTMPPSETLAEMVSFPEIDIPENPLITNLYDNSASAFYDRLAKWIEEFDASLDNAHEVGFCLISFGQATVFHFEDMDYRNPSLISFKGRTEHGEPVELIQHVSQINILLTKLPRPEPDKPKEPFGFARRNSCHDLNDDDKA